jgi:hypothetical protein
MKTQLAIKLSVAALCLAHVSAVSNAREITAPEIASFLGISSWETRVDLPPDTYSIDICPIEDGIIGSSLIAGQIDWSKNADGRFVFISGTQDGNYKLSVSSPKVGGLTFTTHVPVFKGTYNPSLPETVSEGTFILFADTVARDSTGGQNEPATYKRGFVLRVTKKS